MIELISFEQILPVWQNRLWTHRTSQIAGNSAMVFQGGHDGNNMHYVPEFWGYVLSGCIVGVNSGHGCADGSYRSRGLWVDPRHRFQGIGRALLQHAIKRAQDHDATFCWSLPRKQSWPVYESAGFVISGDWFATETNELNAFCQIILR